MLFWLQISISNEVHFWYPNFIRVEIHFSHQKWYVTIFIIVLNEHVHDKNFATFGDEFNIFNDDIMSILVD